MTVKHCSSRGNEALTSDYRNFFEVRASLPRLLRYELAALFGVGIGFTATEAGSDWVIPYVDCVNQSGGTRKCIPVPIYNLVYHAGIRGREIMTAVEIKLEDIAALSTLANGIIPADEAVRFAFVSGARFPAAPAG